VLSDEATPYTHGVLATLDRTYAVVPALWSLEVANGLAIAERRERITQQASYSSWILHRLPIHIERLEATWLWQAIVPLAREHRVSAHGAAYLELAKGEGMCLATLDHDLQIACRTIGVAILEVPWL
jgi:predicted nucleic acid-binding protein